MVDKISGALVAFVGTRPANWAAWRHTELAASILLLGLIRREKHGIANIGFGFET